MSTTSLPWPSALQKEVPGRIHVALVFPKPREGWPAPFGLALDSHGALAGGLHPEEDGVTSKAGGLAAIFIIFLLLPVVWTKELALSRDQTHKPRQ